MPRFKDQAICIRHFEWSETSQVVALLTQEHGKVRGLAKGSKRTSPGAVARFSGGIELLTRGEAVGVTKPTTDLATLTEWDLQNPYHHLRKNLVAQRCAMYAADLTNAFAADHDPNQAIFNAMAQFLQTLARPPERAQALLRFQWSLLNECGYQPELDRDVRSGQSLPATASYTFDPQAGGLTTAEVAGTDHAGAGPWRVRRETVEALRINADDHVSSPQAIVRANRLLCVYARSILDRPLPTMDFVLTSDKM